MPVATDQPLLMHGTYTQQVIVEQSDNLSQPAYAASQLSRAPFLVQPPRPAAPTDWADLSADALVREALKGAPVATVYFRIGTTRELPESAGAVHDLKGGDGRCYVLLGHADPSGPYRLVGPLSEDRALEVSRRMIAQGAQVRWADGRGGDPQAPRAIWPRERRTDVYGKPCGG